jgi:ATPase subunit of ABC transporter with duplicated ATPase domains
MMTIRQKLREFLFWDDYQINQLAENLSGGQVARLAFAMISLSSVDMLLLDEPTNNLDISTQDAIIQGLFNYTGALIIVSHSLDFLERIKIDEIYCISQNKLIHHPYKINDSRFHTELLNILGKGIIE